MKPVLPTIPILKGIAELAPRYDAWFCDVWGVLHDGEQAFPAAAEACCTYRGGGGAIILVSNSPRPAASVVAQLDAFGMPREGYDILVTSGDVTRALLRERPGVRVFHLGPERDKPIFEGLDLSFAGPAEADLVVCSGLFDDRTETPDDYAGLLSELKARALPMLCANPDLKVERGTELVYCAGALAQAYEALGGEVTYSGKPYRPIYDLAFRRLPEHAGRILPASRVLAIGDGLKTDLAGAAVAGFDAVFVASGLHLGDRADAHGLSETELAALFADQPHRPVAALARLKW